MVDSPCVKICELDQDGVCVGCGRTRAEIAGWMSMSDAEKAQVVERADKRKRAMSASDKSNPNLLSRRANSGDGDIPRSISIYTK